ncbi:hypothetical protein ACWGB8_04630 [Kitasatospora sp. NPDC054939]
MMLEKVPQALFGQDFALTSAVVMSAAPVGILVAVRAIHGIGLPLTLLASGASHLALALVPIRIRELRDIDVPISTNNPADADKELSCD